MAFWGIEVKPGKPVSHSFDKVGRRLRISQATLGIGSALTKSLVQCNVGSKSPVFICALLPDKTESCHLDLEFEEVDDVVFSVIGPRSVYLTGYYVSNDRHSTLNSDTESYGEDIANTESEESGHHSDEDHYEDSFIDDGDPAVSPLLLDAVDEGMQDQKKIREAKGRLQRNKFRIIDSDDEITSQNREDEDNYLLSAFKSERSAKDKVLEVGEMTGQVTVETNAESADCGASGHVSMEKVDSVIIRKEPNRKTLSCDASFPSGEVTPEREMELKESRHLSEEAETFGDNSVNQSDPPVHDQVQTNTTKVDNMSGSLHASKEEDKSELAAVNNKKSKRKRKEHADGDETLEGSNHNHKNALKEVKVQQAEADTDNQHQDLIKPNEPNQKPTTTMEVDGDDPSSLPHLACSENDQYLKKRRKKGTIKQRSGGSDDAISDRIPVDDQMKDNVLEHDRLVSDLPATTAEDKKPIADEKVDGAGPSSLPCPAGSENDHCSKKRRKKGSIKQRSGGSNDATSDRILVDDQLKENVLEDDRMVSDLPATTAEHKEPVADGGMNFEYVADGNQIEKPKKKKKKKKGKTQDNRENLNVSGSHLSENESRGPSMSSQVRTLSNGLVIEELALGEQVGKIAAVGKKVKIYYTATLKESGCVFDSNIGKSPYKFRLGDEEIIEGWNIGLEGMHVGDKRRLVIPPSMGYGSQAAGENVPPNSWLVYDVELASVR